MSAATAAVSTEPPDWSARRAVETDRRVSTIFASASRWLSTRPLTFAAWLASSFSRSAAPRFPVIRAVCETEGLAKLTLWDGWNPGGVLLVNRTVETLAE